MSQLNPESLSPDLLRLLESERSRPEPPEVMRRRVLDRLANDLLELPFAEPPSLPGGPTGAGLPAQAKRGLAQARRLVRIVALVAASGIGGGGIHALLRPPKAPIANPVLSPVASSEPVIPPSDTSASRSAPPPTKEPPHPLPPTRPRRPATAAPAALANEVPRPGAGERNERQPDEMLAAERALLEEARTALARGKAKEALALLERCRREFPSGILVEEREALAILALAADGRRAAAVSAASVFREKYPKSMLLRSIDAALGAAP